MSIITALSKVPWDKVLQTAPFIIDKGSKIVSDIQKGNSTKDTIGEIAKLQNEQSELIATLSEQNRQLYKAVKTLAHREKILFGITGFGLLLAVVALIFSALN